MKTIFTTNEPLKMSDGKRTSSCAILLLLCTVLVLSGAANAETNKNSSTCALYCDVPHGKTETKCALMADPTKLNCSREVYSSILRDVSSLDLSNNKLTHVPIWMFPFFKSLAELDVSSNTLTQVPSRMFRFCKSLTELTLAHNSIKTIGSGTFTNMENLRNLNLSFNDLRKWEIDPNNELQSLSNIDVTGNEQWLPGEQLIQLKNITTVQGVTWTEDCKNCSLVKIKGNDDQINSTSEPMCERYKLSSPIEWPFDDQIQYGKALDFIMAGFWPTCLCDDACAIDQYYLPYSKVVGDVTRKVFFSLYATGSVAILVNTTVVLVILFHKSLRGDLAVWLILNIAVCDVLIGVFSVLYATFYDKTLSMDGVSRNPKFVYYNNVTGSILTCAVTSEICGSFISTLEKFLKIVYTMKPDIRIGKRSVIPFLLISWSLAVTFAVLPVFDEVEGMTYDNFSEFRGLPLVGGRYGVLVLYTLLNIQLVSLVLYVPIFIVAKKSAANAGVKREATIAKKIALLVFTNFIFFAAPILFDKIKSILLISRPVTYTDGVTVSKYPWLLFALNYISVLCLNINSVLNPFLYAIRHPKIKQQLKKIVSRCRTVFSECFVVLAEQIHCMSNTVQHENNMEMQEQN